MRRIIIALCLFLATPAFAAEWYVDRTIIATGTVVSGTNNTTFNIGTPTYTTGFTSADVANAGIYFTSGTGIPNANTPCKIATFTAGTGAATTTASMGATPTSNWVYVIIRGTNYNTGGSATPGSGTTGPKATFYTLINSSASSGDRINIRGGQYADSSPIVYDEAANLNNSAYGMYCASNSKNLIFEGFETVAGDLVPASGTRATTSNNAKFPLITGGSSSSKSMEITNAISSATTLTLRALTMTNTNAAGSCIHNSGAGATVSIRGCVIGTSTMVAGGSGIQDLTTSGVTKSCTIVDSTMFTEDAWYIGGCGLIDWSNTAFTATVAASGNYPIQLYGTEGSATDNILKATIASCDFTYTGASSTASLINCTGLTHMNGMTIRNCSAAYNMNGNFIRVSDGIPNLLIENNTIVCSATPTANTILALGLDTAVGQFFFDRQATVIASASAGAGGTGNVSSSGTTFVLATGSSATDDFYNNLCLRFPLNQTIFTQRISDYTGGTRTVTIWGTFSAAATAPAYQIVKYDPVRNSVVVRNNTMSFTGDRSHVILFGQGCDGALAENNTCLNGDYSIVIKAEDCRIIGNKATGETPFILKGANRNIVLHNTFHSTAVGGSAACIEFSDKSPVVENLNGVLYSKCSGNIIMNNIISCASGISNRLMFEYDIGDGSWAEDTDDGPLRQNNLIDYNVYSMGNGANFAYVDSANVATFAAWKTKMANVEADGLPYCKLYPLNDANSVAIDPRLVDPENGNFRPQIRVIGSDGQMIGAPVPAHIANRIPILNTN